MTDHHDEDTTALFDEIEKEKKGDYQTCSASQTFDAVWQCYSKQKEKKTITTLFLKKISIKTALGSQAVNYYRYGTKRDCSMKWEDFKFCLTTKTKPSEKADVNRQKQPIYIHRY